MQVNLVRWRRYLSGAGKQLPSILLRYPFRGLLLQTPIFAASKKIIPHAKHG